MFKNLHQSPSHEIFHARGFMKIQKLAEFIRIYTTILGFFEIQIAIKATLIFEESYQMLLAFGAVGLSGTDFGV